MEQRKEEITRRPLFVYDLPDDVLSSLAPRDATGAEAQDDLPSSDIQASKTTPDVVGSKACSLCSTTFHTVEEQRGHIKSDWHAYNLKQKIRGARPVTEGEFETLVGDLNESLSGSDSSDSEDDEDDHPRKETTLSALLRKQAAISSESREDAEDAEPKKRKRGSGKPPLFWFKSSILPSNTYLGIYRSIFTDGEQEKELAILETLQKKQLIPKPTTKVPTDPNTGVPLPVAYNEPHIFLCMIGGGHFAAMIVSLTPKQTRSTPTGPLTKEATVLAHKTFHRYTTRRKQGGAQSANDAAKGAAHSAGSSLRRYNEQALTDEVRLLLQDWKGMVDTSELLFIRATGSTNRRTLFGPYDGQVLRQNDPRIRGFPFSTRRATQNELMRSFVELTRVKVFEVDEAAIAAAQKAAEDAAKQSAITKASKQSAPAAPKRSKEEELAITHTQQIQALVRRSKFPALLSYLKDNQLPADFRFAPQDAQSNHHAPTPLHLAASQNSVPLITGLLKKASADPTLPNADGKTAFDLAGDRASRDAFRVARFELGATAWDWEAAHVPAALSKAEADARAAAEKKEEAAREEERRRAETERLKAEGPKAASATQPLGKAAGKGRAMALGQMMGGRTAQERRETELRGLTPEMRVRMEREQRARAAEARMKKMSGGGGGG